MPRLPHSPRQCRRRRPLHSPARRRYIRSINRWQGNRAAFKDFAAHGRRGKIHAVQAVARGLAILVSAATPRTPFSQLDGEQRKASEYRGANQPCCKVHHVTTRLREQTGGHGTCYSPRSSTAKSSPASLTLAPLPKGEGLVTPPCALLTWGGKLLLPLQLRLQHHRHRRLRRRHHIEGATKSRDSIVFMLIGKSNVAVATFDTEIKSPLSPESRSWPVSGSFENRCRRRPS